MYLSHNLLLISHTIYNQFLNLLPVDFRTLFQSVAICCFIVQSISEPYSNLLPVAYISSLSNRYSRHSQIVTLASDMDQHFNYEAFASLCSAHYLAWCNLSTVLVDFVWEDMEQGKLYIILLDKNMDKMLAVVPKSLVNLYTQTNLVGGVFSLSHFQVGFTYHEYPRYEKYSLARDDFFIDISRNTRFIPLRRDVERGLVFYPLVISIQALVEDTTPRKMLIDVVGKIINGGRSKYRGGSCDLFLQDGTGHIIKLRLHDTSTTPIMKIAKAVINKSIFYASRVKLIHRNSMNFLSSTDLTKVAIDPDMPEAHHIRLMLG